MKIVRYSPAERRNKAYLGEDAIIRFYVNQRNWSGEQASVLTFSNDFARRYPVEYAFALEATRGLDFRVGGAHNRDLPNAIGAVDYERQLREIRQSRAYLYSHGISIPYTLNFIEAWSSGIPIVARDPKRLPPDLSGFYSEIGDLIQDSDDRLLGSRSTTTRTPS